MKCLCRTTVAFIMLWLIAGTAAWAAEANTAPVTTQASANEFSYHHTNVLGTSLDLIVITPDQTVADSAEKAVLDEVGRLNGILSTHDSAAELARLSLLAPGSPPVKVSSEIIEVLADYDHWQKATNGVCNGHLGDLIALYKSAEKANQFPAEADLAPVVAMLAQPAWQVDEANQTIRRMSTQPINADSVGKGYIIGKAVAAARKEVPAIAGILLNIGGDMRVAGSSDFKVPAPWRIGVADPLHFQDNADPLTVLLLSDQTVATSAAYERFYTIGGKKYSHILDPRSGKPANTVGGALSATVVAKDDPTANALATSLCVLPPEEGLSLVATIPGAQCLIVTADGRQLRSAGFKALEAPMQRHAATQPSLWPNGYQVTVNLDIANSRKKPYVFCWVTDKSGKHIKTIAAWGNESKYLRAVRDWYKFYTADPTLKAVTRATRRAGKYTIAWDGTDQAGAPVPPGTYTITLEVAVEHGPNSTKSGTIVCDKNPATGKIEQASAFNEATISYGPSEN